MKALFDKVSVECSRLTTQKYSTSFSLGIRLFAPEIRPAIYSIYGFVRLADEIVDSFDGYNRGLLLQQFKTDTYLALENKISLNPILNSFQQVVHQYNIGEDLIEAFLLSMEMDLEKRFYTRELYEKYIFGSAEVVGLMCLRVFCANDDELYEKLKFSAMKLGSAFQKVNFLRDIQADYANLGRMYFPNLDFDKITDWDKKLIEAEIAEEFGEALKGIQQLPKSSRSGVYLAFLYYRSLLKKIQNTPATQIKSVRIRIPDLKKATLLFNTVVLNKIGYV